MNENMSDELKDLKSLGLEKAIQEGKPVSCGEGWILRNLSEDEMKDLMRGNCQYCKPE